jgi:hypothetical protein
MIIGSGGKDSHALQRGTRRRQCLRSRPPEHYGSIMLMNKLTPEKRRTDGAEALWWATLFPITWGWLL